MRTRINLATQPYANLQRFWFVWGAALLAAAVISGALVYAAAQAWRQTHRTAHLIAEERDRLDKLEQQEKKDRDLLNSDQNRDVRVRSEFLNSLILRKQFSWTQIFTDLERIMPDRVHVVSITPELTPEQQIQVRLMVAGTSREKAIELVSNMERSSTFRQARILSESTADTEEPRTAGDTVQLQISAIYQPPAEAPQPAPRSGQ